MVFACGLPAASSIVLSNIGWKEPECYGKVRVVFPCEFPPAILPATGIQVVWRLLPDWEVEGRLPRILGLRLLLG